MDNSSKNPDSAMLSPVVIRLAEELAYQNFIIDSKNKEIEDLERQLEKERAKNHALRAKLLNVKKHWNDNRPYNMSKYKLDE